MSGLKKIFLAFFATAVFLTLLLTVLIKFVFPSGHFKNYIERRISRVAGNNAELKNVSAGLYGIMLDGLKVSSADQFELTVEKIIVSPNPFPFPRKQVAFNEIKIINPEILIGKNFRDFKIKKSFLSYGHTLVLNRLTVEGGIIRFPRWEVRSVRIEVKNASVTGSFPVEISFDVRGAVLHAAAEYNFQKRHLKITNSVLKGGKKSAVISGFVENLPDPVSMKFEIDFRGDGELFGQIFLQNLHKKKIDVFGGGNVNLKISGNVESFQIINGTEVM